MSRDPVFLNFGDALAGERVRWAEARVIEEPPRVERFRDATFVPGSFSYSPERAYHGGLLDDEGRFIEFAARQRAGRPLGNEPPLTPGKTAPIGQGEAIYGGVLAGNYGHFLFETLARLWPRVEDPEAPLLFHAIQRPDPSTGFLRAALDALGIAQERVLLPSVETRVAAIAVPEATARIKYSVHRALLDTAGRLREAFGARRRGEAGRKLYLSRALLPRKCLIGEDYLERLMAADGYQIVYPELLSFPDQLRLFDEAGTVIGCGGSALHNILFGDPGVRVVHIAREAEINANFFLFDKLRGVEATYLASSPGASGDPPFLLDLPLIVETLAGLGLVSADSALPSPAALAAELEAERTLEASYAPRAALALAEQLEARRANPAQELRHRLRAAEIRLRTGDMDAAERGLAICARLAESLGRPTPPRLAQIQSRQSGARG